MLWCNAGVDGYVGSQGPEVLYGEAAMARNLRQHLLGRLSGKASDGGGDHRPERQDGSIRTVSSSQHVHYVGLEFIEGHRRDFRSVPRAFARSCFRGCGVRA